MVNPLKKTTIPLALLFSLLCVLFFVLPDLVYGQETGGYLPYDPNAVRGGGIALFVYQFVLTFLGFITMMMGNVMDYVLTYFVFGYGYFYNTAFGGAVEVSWTVIRDLMNVAFIFGLVYIGLRFILFADDGAAKRNLALLIIAALLVNFSLFFAKAIVDVSHGILYEFNSQVEFVDLDVENSSVDTLSGAIMYTFAISSVVGAGGVNIEGTNGWVMVGLLTLTFLLLSFVFIAVAAILVIRTVVITFLLIFSPIMFIGWVFPSLSNMSSTWLRTFLKQSFLAPIIFLFLYISLIITDAIFMADGSRGALEPTNYQTYSGFVLGIAFLIISLVAAQKLGSSAAGASVKMLDNGRRRLQTRTANMAKSGVRVATAPVRAPANAAGRLAVGGGGRLLEKLNNKMERTKRGRRIKAPLAVLGFNERARQQAFTAMQNRKFGGYSYQDNKDFNEKQQVKRNRLENEAARSEVMAGVYKTFKNTDATAQELNDALNDLSDTIKQMSDTELANTKPDRLNDPAFAANLTDRQIEGLEKSGKFSNDQIGAIKNARKTGQIRVATTGVSLNAGKYTNSSEFKLKKSQRQNMVSKGVNEAGKLPPEVYTNPAMYAYITPRMLEERIKNGVTQEQTTQMYAALDKYRKNSSDSAASQWDKWENSNSIYAAQLFANSTSRLPS